MTANLHTQTPLELAQQHLAKAEQEAAEARAAVARAAVEQARNDGERGDVYARAGRLLGTSERTIHRMLKVTKSVTSSD